MIAGPRTFEPMSSAPASITTRPSTCESLVDLAVDAGLDASRAPAGCLEQRVHLAGVDPPAVSTSCTTAVAVVDQPLDGVGDLELAAGRRLDRAHGLVDGRRRTGTRRRARGSTAGRRASRPAARRGPPRRASATPKRCGSGTGPAGSAPAHGARRPGSARRRSALVLEAVDERPRRPAGSCCRRGT